MRHVVASPKSFHSSMPDELGHQTGEEFLLIRSPQDLTLEKLAEIKPRYIFFPHWSHIIPAAIYEQYECVIFHMTDVPFGRGGSPLQNLIARGLYDTKITALRCTAELDAGPVYLKKDFSLQEGNADAMLIRAGRIITDMIVEIIETQPAPIPQVGEPTFFARRKPTDGNLFEVDDIHKLYDHIRMLDGEGYPRAYLETSAFRFEFEQAVLEDSTLTATVRIHEKSKVLDVFPNTTQDRVSPESSSTKA